MWELVREDIARMLFVKRLAARTPDMDETTLADFWDALDDDDRAHYYDVVDVALSVLRFDSNFVIMPVRDYSRFMDEISSLRLWAEMGRKKRHQSA